MCLRLGRDAFRAFSSVPNTSVFFLINASYSCGNKCHHSRFIHLVLQTLRSLQARSVNTNGSGEPAFKPFSALTTVRNVSWPHTKNKTLWHWGRGKGTRRESGDRKKADESERKCWEADANDKNSPASQLYQVPAYAQIISYYPLFKKFGHFYVIHDDEDDKMTIINNVTLWVSTMLSVG